VVYFVIVILSWSRLLFLGEIGGDKIPTKAMSKRQRQTMYDMIHKPVDISVFVAPNDKNDAVELVE